MYVYKSLEEYVKLYPKGQDKINEDHLCAFWINDKNVVVVGKSREGAAGYRPDFSKSIIYFDEGEEAFDKYEDNYEPVVEIKVDKSFVTFIGQEVEKKFAIARKYGEYENGHVKGYILYDDGRPRLNLIVEKSNV